MRWFLIVGMLMIMTGCDEQPAERAALDKAPPMGRNISLDASRMSQFREELERRNVTFWSGSYQGYEYIAWDAASDVAADAVLQTVSVNDHLFAEMQKMRRAADADQDLTSSSEPTQK